MRYSPDSSFEVGEADKVDPELSKKEGRASPFDVKENSAELQTSELKSETAKSSISPTFMVPELYDPEKQEAELTVTVKSPQIESCSPEFTESESVTTISIVYSPISSELVG